MNHQVTEAAGSQKDDKVVLKTSQYPETVKHVQKKLVDKGMKRMERHPTRDGLPVSLPPHKFGHGGKFTWEGPADEVTSQLDPVPPAIDEKDPNYVDEGEDDQVLLEGVENPEVSKMAEERIVEHVKLD
ncbi:uncharacterized protein LOC124942915 [Impatiens glandulifera]|uniref:uncharacterized protein LOC124942915 n=1 Tax=Impatiens glandulifera TaxID=253017 RepID=UPI001FB0B732|nr:uncharacterized protein LOC124942915 [Impatiens glandulifera]